MRRLFIFFCFTLLICPASAYADLDSGLLAYQAQDFETAYRELLPLAEAGDPQAQLHIANLYSDGQHVAQDHEVALDWYEKSAAQGNISAQIAAGTSYLEGIGTEPNNEKAFVWIEKAAVQNNELGQVLIGLLYHEGRGVDKDVLTAYKWFLIAMRNTSQGNWSKLAAGLAEEVKKTLPPEDILKAEALAREFKPTSLKNTL